MRWQTCGTLHGGEQKIDLCKAVLAEIVPFRDQPFKPAMRGRDVEAARGAARGRSLDAGGRRPAAVARRGRRSRRARRCSALDLLQNPHSMRVELRLRPLRRRRARRLAHARQARAGLHPAPRPVLLRRGRVSAGQFLADPEGILLKVKQAARATPELVHVLGLGSSFPTVAIHHMVSQVRACRHRCAVPWSHCGAAGHRHGRRFPAVPRWDRHPSHQGDGPDRNPSHPELHRQKLRVERVGAAPAGPHAGAHVLPIRSPCPRGAQAPASHRGVRVQTNLRTKQTPRRRLRPATSAATARRSTTARRTAPCKRRRTRALRRALRATTSLGSEATPTRRCMLSTSDSTCSAHPKWGRAM